MSDVTLDTWKPSEKKEGLIQSNWRREKIGDNFNQHVDYSDLRKIKAYLKKNASDYEIMRVFGITAEKLVAIKKNKYTPENGIEPDNKELDAIEDKLIILKIAIDYIAEMIFISEESRLDYESSCRKKAKKAIKYKNKVKGICQEGALSDTDEEETLYEE
jgi:hypothetical protein